MIIAIHQPNFLPWQGLFQRIYLSDTFVFFDHVQAMGGRSWLSRNRILVSGQNHWLTMPVLKSGRLGQNIHEVEINYETNFIAKHLRTIELNYGKAPYFEEFFPKLTDIYKSHPKYICNFNARFIAEVSDFLGLNCSFVSSSDMLKNAEEIRELKGNDLILQICITAGAKQYISGTGCLDFIEPGSFTDAGIEFYFQNFTPHPYSQQKTSEFVSHLSIIDALFCIGREQTAKIVSQSAITKP